MEFKSKHFKLDDFLVSPIKFFEKKNKEISPGIAFRLNELASFLDSFWDITAPIKIIYGYRCENLNNAISAANTSRHQLGEAVDFNFGDVQLLDYNHYASKIGSYLDVKKIIFGSFEKKVFKNGLRYLHFSLGLPYIDARFCCRRNLR